MPFPKSRIERLVAAVGLIGTIFFALFFSFGGIILNEGESSDRGSIYFAAAAGLMIAASFGLVGVFLSHDRKMSGKFLFTAGVISIVSVVVTIPFEFLVRPAALLFVLPGALLLAAGVSLRLKFPKTL